MTRPYLSLQKTVLAEPARPSPLVLEPLQMVLPNDHYLTYHIILRAIRR